MWSVCWWPKPQRTYGPSYMVRPPGTGCQEAVDAGGQRVGAGGEPAPGGVGPAPAAGLPPQGRVVAVVAVDDEQRPRRTRATGRNQGADCQGGPDDAAVGP